MISINPNSKNVLSFGTDDETALVQAFEESLDAAVHLLCERHMRGNVSSKFKALGAPSAHQAKFEEDLFGAQRDGEYVSGLIDCPSREEFKKRCEILKRDWQAVGITGIQAWEWFERNKSDKFYSCLGVPAREQAGLGSPPERFTTNPSECNNKLVQDFVRKDTGKRRV
jgi:hypothetical protein